jgi:MoxR-like ATPase
MTLIHAKPESSITQVAEKVRQIADGIETVIVGKRTVVEMALTAFLCGGHVLLEDVPGTGKTTLAKSLARALGCVFKRVQFTPDLLPTDITGTAIFNQRTQEFEFREGPVFANIVLADEINRATPKTQSSLLECMEERQVTSDGITYELPLPFFVIATENNIEAQGTHPLPEAQLDRFLMRLSMGYPSRAEESLILERQTRDSPLQTLHSVVTKDELLALQAEVRTVYIDRSLREYIVDLVTATRDHPQVLLGASPRGSLFLLHASQAYAALQGRAFVLPDDIKRLAPAILAHRVILRPEARLKRTTAVAVIDQVLTQIPVPISA